LSEWEDVLAAMAESSAIASLLEDQVAMGCSCPCELCLALNEPAVPVPEVLKGDDFEIAELTALCDAIVPDWVYNYPLVVVGCVCEYCELWRDQEPIDLIDDWLMCKPVTHGPLSFSYFEREMAMFMTCLPASPSKTLGKRSRDCE